MAPVSSHGRSPRSLPAGRTATWSRGRCTASSRCPTAPARIRRSSTIHGGPEAHDEDAFSATAQAWVDHGLAVVMVNYRGSTGYGNAWRDAIVGRPRAHRARGHRRDPREARRRRDRGPDPRRHLRRLVGRLPHAARPRDAARALVARYRGRPGRRLRRRVRGRDGGAEALRRGPLRRYARAEPRRRIRVANPLTAADRAGSRSSSRSARTTRAARRGASTCTLRG